MLEKQQEKLKEINIKFMEKSIDLVLEGKVHKVDLTGVSIAEVLKYFNSKVPKVHQLGLMEIGWGMPKENRFSYDVGLEQKYSIVGDFFHSWIEFSLNSSYDN